MLLIDVGNTRVKWSVLDGDTLSEPQAASHIGWIVDDVRRQITDVTSRPNAVAISNVGGHQIGQVISSAIKATWGVEPTFARTSAVSAGVRCGYAQPQKLGIDRWLGVIAAHHLLHSHACVVGVGTAMTVDAVTLDGQHLGGVIVPGPDMMIESLMKRTSDIAAHAIDGEHRANLFADNTLAAVYQGATHALAALVERAMNDMCATLGSQPILVLTGGASSRVACELRVPFKVIPELVLRGLAIVSRDTFNVSV